jgi:hypothetical protein
MKKIEPTDPLLDEFEEAQRKLEAEFDNDPAKLLAHFEEVQKRHAHKLVSRHVASRVATQAAAMRIESTDGSA